MGFLALLGPLLRLPRWVYAVLAAVAALGLLWALHGHWERSAYNRAYNDGWEVEHARLEQTVANYRAAATLAAKQDAQNVVRVKDEQAAITEKVSHDYEADIAAARARADALRVRISTARTDSGSPAKPGLPTAGSTAGRSDGAPGEDGLSGEWSIADRLTATEQAIRLAALQDWVRAQAKVDTTGETK